MTSELHQQTAHVLLDALSVFDDLSNPDPDPAIVLALRRLEEIDAVTILYDDGTDTRTVDVTPVLSAALSLLAASVVGHLHDAPHLDGVTAINHLRTAIDRAAEA